jgi:glycerophosphoryl diester phosphodiesterase
MAAVPYSIAHRAGNNLHTLDAALAAGVDAIECDFWHARGRLVLRHERKLPLLPVLYDRWRIGWSWGELSLRDLLREVNFRTELFLDIKSSTPRAADAVLDLYRDNASMLPPTGVSSQQWRLLDHIASERTGMRIFYSVGRQDQMGPLLASANNAHPPTGTSIRHTLLSRELVARLHDSGLLVYAWTANTQERADELVSWGIDGLISDDLDLLRRRTSR